MGAGKSGTSNLRLCGRGASALYMLCLRMGVPMLHWRGVQILINSSKIQKLKITGWLFVWSKLTGMC